MFISMARTLQPLDWDKIESYLKAGATQKNIAGSLGISVDTLHRRVLQEKGRNYADYAESFRCTGEMLLEAAQFEKALDSHAPGNAQMLIWLGKIRLGQREPEPVTILPPAQNELTKDQKIMELEHKIAELEANGYKSQAE